MPSLPEQSRSEEQRPSKNKNKTTQMRPPHLKTESDHQKKLSYIMFTQRLTRDREIISLFRVMDQLFSIFPIMSVGGFWSNCR